MKYFTATDSAVQLQCYNVFASMIILVFCNTNIFINKKILSLDKDSLNKYKRHIWEHYFINLKGNMTESL